MPISSQQQNHAKTKKNNNNKNGNHKYNDSIINIDILFGGNFAYRKDIGIDT